MSSSLRWKTKKRTRGSGVRNAGSRLPEIGKRALALVNSFSSPRRDKREGRRVRTEYSALLYHVVVPKLRLTLDMSQASLFTVRIDCCDMTRKEFRTQQELYAKHQLRRIERHVRANDKRLYGRHLLDIERAGNGCRRKEGEHRRGYKSASLYDFPSCATRPDSTNASCSKKISHCSCIACRKTRRLVSRVTSGSTS